MTYLPRTPKEEKAFTEGILRGKEHSTPSPDTKKFMENINTEMQYMKEAIKTIKENMVTADSMDLANEKLAKIIAKEVLDCVAKNYATKLALEKVKSRVNWYSFIVPILTGALGVAVTYLLTR